MFRLVQNAWLVVALACVASADLPTRPAFAQDEARAARPPLAESLQGAAKQAYDSATILADNGNWEGAAAKYGQAYVLSSDPRLLWNMAICARELKAYARMQELLVRYESEAGDGLSPESRAEVDAALAAIHNLVGTVRPEVSEAGALVTIDGRVAGEAPLKEPIVLDLGRHTVTAGKAGFETANQPVDIVGGDDVPVVLKLQRPPRLIVVADTGSNVIVDRREVTGDRFEGVLTAGEHEVQVTARGKKRFVARVQLRSEETKTMRVTLQDESHIPLWAWVAGSAAVVVGGSVGGYFLLRKHDDTSQLMGNLPMGQVVVSP